MMATWIREQNWNWGAWLGLVLVVLVVSVSFWRVAQQSFIPDYWMYSVLIESWKETNHLAAPQFLYPLTAIMIDAVLPGVSVDAATIITTVVYSAAYVVVLYVLVNRALGGGRVAWTVFFTLSLFVATPVLIFTIPFNNFVYGYMPVTYHNPTMAVVKPFIIPSFLLCLGLFRQGITNRVVWIAALVIATILAKPNYAIALLPTLGLAAGYKLLMREYVDLRALVGAVFVPALLILAVQYLSIYVTDTGTLGEELANEGIAIRPFAVLNHHAETLNEYANQYIWLKFGMSFLFPLSVYALHWRVARRDFRLNVAWLYFFISAFFTYFVVETGETLFHGNFTWTGYIGFVVLFVVSTLFFVEHNRSAFVESFREALNWRFDLMLFCLLLHVVSGLGWYGMHLNGNFKFWF